MNANAAPCVYRQLFSIKLYKVLICQCYRVDKTHSQPLNSLLLEQFQHLGRFKYEEHDDDDDDDVKTALQGFIKPQCCYGGNSWECQLRKLC